MLSQLEIADLLMTCTPSVTGTDKILAMFSNNSIIQIDVCRDLTIADAISEDLPKLRELCLQCSKVMAGHTKQHTTHTLHVMITNSVFAR